MNTPGVILATARAILDDLHNWLPTAGRQRMWDPKPPECVDRNGDRCLSRSDNAARWTAEGVLYSQACGNSGLGDAVKRSTEAWCLLQWTAERHFGHTVLDVNDLGYEAVLKLYDLAIRHDLCATACIHLGRFCRWAWEAGAPFTRAGGAEEEDAA